MLAGEMSDAERAEVATLISLSRTEAGPAEAAAERPGRMVPKDAVPADRRVPHDVLQIHPQFCA